MLQSSSNHVIRLDFFNQTQNDTQSDTENQTQTEFQTGLQAKDAARIRTGIQIEPETGIESQTQTII